MDEFEETYPPLPPGPLLEDLLCRLGIQGDAKREEAIAEIQEIVGSFLELRRDQENAPGVAKVRTHLSEIAILARRLEQSLGKVDQWIGGACVSGLGDAIHPALYHEHPLFHSSGLDEFPLWGNEKSGSPSWQTRLDALAQVAELAIQSLPQCPGARNVSHFQADGNSKSLLVWQCKDLLKRWGKDPGWTRKGPLVTFVGMVHEIATGFRGNGWADIIREIKPKPGVGKTAEK